jgi:hypothetical protein
MRKPLNARSTKFVKIQTSTRATLGANPVKSEWRLHHQAIPGGECRGMWPDCYSDSRPA